MRKTCHNRVALYVWLSKCQHTPLNMTLPRGTMAIFKLIASLPSPFPRPPLILMVLKYTIYASKKRGRHQENMSVKSKPLEPHFYIEKKKKLGLAGVYLFFLFLLQNIDCGYSLEPPRRGGSNVYPQSMF